MATMLDLRKLKNGFLTTKEADDLYGCSPRHIAELGQEGKLTRHVLSDRAIFYDPTEVRLLAKENAELRKKRGGRPRKAG